MVGLFDMSKGLPLFKTHLRDFVVQMKEFEKSLESLKAGNTLVDSINATQVREDLCYPP